MANPCTPTAIQGAMFSLMQRILDAVGSFNDGRQSGEDDENSLAPCPSKELLQCAQKQIMDKLLLTWNSLAICFDQFMSLSQHEKTKIMDDCGDGFKELVALHLVTSLVRRLRHRLSLLSVTCLGKQMCKMREGPCIASKPYFPPLVFRMCVTCCPTAAQRVRVPCSTSTRFARIHSCPDFCLRF